MLRLKKISFDSTDGKREGREVTNLAVGLNLSSVESKNGELTVGFVYAVRYNPNGGHINLSGTAVLEGEKNETALALQKWKKEKKITGEVGEQLLNILTNASALNAIFIARVLDLGPPFALPQIKITEKPAVKK